MCAQRLARDQFAIEKGCVKKCRIRRLCPTAFPTLVLYFLPDGASDVRAVFWPRRESGNGLYHRHRQRAAGSAADCDQHLLCRTCQAPGGCCLPRTGGLFQPPIRNCRGDASSLLPQYRWTSNIAPTSLQWHLQLKVAVHVIEDWLKANRSRTGSRSCPDEMAILPADFSVATQRANSIDPHRRREHGCGFALCGGG